MNDEIPNCSLYNNDVLIQYFIRTSVISIALLSSLFIAITCLLSGRRQYWGFKLLFWQSIAETIVLILALSFSINSACVPHLCKYVAYVMESSWITSFLCSLMIFIMYYGAVNASSYYSKFVKNMNWIIVILFIIPYIWFITPLMLDCFGPAGWKLYNGDTVYFYCGFIQTGDASNYFLIFWILPLVIIFCSSCYVSCRSSSIVNKYIQAGVDTVEAKLIQNLKILPQIYIFSWGIHTSILFVFLLPEGKFSSSKIYYYTVVSLYILFELHIPLVAVMFYKYYNPILHIRHLWTCRQPPLIQSFDQVSCLINETTSIIENQ